MLRHWKYQKCTLQLHDNKSIFIYVTCTMYIHLQYLVGIRKRQPKEQYSTAVNTMFDFWLFSSDLHIIQKITQKNQEKPQKNQEKTRKHPENTQEKTKKNLDETQKNPDKTQKNPRKNPEKNKKSQKTPENPQKKLRKNLEKKIKKDLE